MTELTKAEVDRTVRWAGNLIALNAVPADVPAAWAVLPLTGHDVAHYFRRGEGGIVLRMVRSACGLATGYETGRAPLLNPGNFPRCKRCERSAP